MIKNFKRKIAFKFYGNNMSGRRAATFEKIIVTLLFCFSDFGGKSPLPVSVWEKGCSWRQAGLDGLETQGIVYREAFQSAHISEQKAAILADLAIAPLPRSSIDDKIVVVDKKYNLPPLPQYALGLIVAKNATAPVKAAADHLRAYFAGQ